MFPWSSRAVRSSFASAWVAMLLCVVVGSARASGPAPDQTEAVPAPALDAGFPIITTGPGFAAPPQFVDMDVDGKSEILAIDKSGVIYVVGSKGYQVTGWPLATGEAASGNPAVGDIDGDGKPDVVVVAASGRVRCYTGFGVLRFVAVLPAASHPIGSPVLVELDASGRQAAVVATTDGKLFAIDADGNIVPGWPITGPGPAVGGAFTFIGGDNFPRVGYLASPGGAAIYFTYTALDAPNSYDPGVPLGRAMPVSGDRIVGVLSDDIDHLYLPARGGQLYRFDPNIIGSGGDPIALTPILGDSIVDTPSLLDVTRDMIPELAVRSLRGDTLSITLMDGAAGTVRAGFPKKYIGSAPGGAIVAADLGDADNGRLELVFNQGGDKVTCLNADGVQQFTLTNLPAIAGPAIGDMEGDGQLDMAVVTTTGRIVAYSLGGVGQGAKSIEWPNADGLPDHGRRHRVRDRAMIRAQWPAPITPVDAFTTRPVIADITGDGIQEAIWSDYTTNETYAWNQSTGVIGGWPQTYVAGAIADAPAVGDVTGDHVLETVQSLSNGSVVWGDKNGTLGSMLVDSGRILTPPALADLNGDGTLDVVVGSSSGRLYALNLISKTVLAGFPVTTSGPITLPAALGDVNGDGQTDIVVAANTRYIYAYGKGGGAPLAGWPRLFPTGNRLTQPILVPVAGNPGLAVSFGQVRADSVFANLVGSNSASLSGWPKALTGTDMWGPIAGLFNFDSAPDFVFSTNADSAYVFLANGGRALTKYINVGSTFEVVGMVDVNLDQRPDIIAITDQSAIKAIDFAGNLLRSFDRHIVTTELDQPPAFGDLGNDGVMDMAFSDQGYPMLFSFGPGTWNAAANSWPMKGHDAKRTNAYSGLTVVGVGDPGPIMAAGPIAGWARAFPNPTAGRVALAHSRPLSGHFEASIYDLRGRLVRRIATGEGRAGDPVPTWTWDGRDEDGRSATAGVYFYRVVDRLGSLTTRVVRLE